MAVQWIAIMESIDVKALLDSGPASGTGPAFRRNDGLMQRSPTTEN